MKYKRKRDKEREWKRSNGYENNKKDKQSIRTEKKGKKDKDINKNTLNKDNNRERQADRSRHKS